MKQKLFLLLANMLFATAVFAQTGTIRGTVYDAADGEPMIGATIQLEGTSTGTACDMDGKYSLKLPAGTHKLIYSFVSYAPQTQEVVVTAGEVLVLDVRLGESNDVLEEVQIVAKADRAGEAALLTMQKKSPVLLDAMSSEQISRNGDNNVAAAIKRVPGVTIEGGKYVYVRGLGDRYSKTVLNGAEIPGLDPNKNSVQLDLFPANLVDNLAVYKSFAPNLPGDFTGGYIDIVTKDLPDNFTFKVTSSLGYNTQANLNGDFLSYEGGSTDFLGFDDGGRAMPSSLRGSVPAPYQNDAKLAGLSRAFGNTNMNTQNATSMLDHNMSVSVGNQKEIGKESSFGYVAALTYRRNYESYNGGTTGRYSFTGAELQPEYVLDDSRSSDNVIWGAMLNTAFKVNANHKISLNLFHNQGGERNTRFQQGPWNVIGALSDNVGFETRTLAFLERSMSNLQLRGEHSFAGGKFKAEWFTSYTYSAQDEPDLRFFTDNYTIDAEGNTFYAITASRYNEPSRYYRKMQEVNWDTKAHFTWNTNLIGEHKAKIKFGGAFTAKQRLFRENRFMYVFDPSADLYDGNIANYLSDNNLWGQRSGAYYSGVYMDNVTVAANNYNATQYVGAAYAMIETPITDRLKVTAGARLETTQLSLTSKDRNQPKGKLNLADVLPALNITYALNDRTNLRASATRTLARPTFREIAPLATFDFVGDFIQLGDPTLKRTLVDNVDLRWEMYPAHGEYLSVSPFYKRFQNPIENTINPQAGNLEYQYANVGKAELYGVELEVRKNLSFLGESFSNFKIGTNVTLVKSLVDIDGVELAELQKNFPGSDSRRSLYGQSPFIVNAYFLYEDIEKGTSVNLSFNVFGKRLALASTVLPYVYEQPRPELNLSAQKSLSERWKLTLRANNLLNPENKKTMEYQGQEYIFQNYTTGRNFSLGVSYTID